MRVDRKDPRDRLQRAMNGASMERCLAIVSASDRQHRTAIPRLQRRNGIRICDTQTGRHCSPGSSITRVGSGFRDPATSSSWTSSDNWVLCNPAGKRLRPPYIRPIIKRRNMRSGPIRLNPWSLRGLLPLRVYRKVRCPPAASRLRFASLAPPRPGPFTLKDSSPGLPLPGRGRRKTGFALSAAMRLALRNQRSFLKLFAKTR